MKYYIRLLVDVELDEKQKHIWYKLVDEFTNKKTTIRDQYINEFMNIADDLKGTDDFPYSYVVYLNDQIEMKEAESIVYIWNKIFPVDFEIDSSIQYNPENEEDVEIDEALYEEIVKRANKFLHNRWVEDKIQEGWRYGTDINITEKTDPRLRDWDALNEDYKIHMDITREQAVSFLKKYPYIFV